MIPVKRKMYKFRLIMLCRHHHHNTGRQGLDDDTLWAAAFPWRRRKQYNMKKYYNYIFKYYTKKWHIFKKTEGRNDPDPLIILLIVSALECVSYVLLCALVCVRRCPFSAQFWFHCFVCSLKPCPGSTLLLLRPHTHTRTYWKFVVLNRSCEGISMSTHAEILTLPFIV